MWRKGDTGVLERRGQKEDGELRQEARREEGSGVVLDRRCGAQGHGQAASRLCLGGCSLPQAEVVRSIKRRK